MANASPFLTPSAEQAVRELVDGGLGLGPRNGLPAARALDQVGRRVAAFVAIGVAPQAADRPQLRRSLGGGAVGGGLRVERHAESLVGGDRRIHARAGRE